MAKDRVKDALDYIKRAFAGHESTVQGDKAKGATWDWLEKHPEVTGISALLSIGGFRGIKALRDEAKTELRQYQRAYLLIQRTLGGKSDAQVSVLKARFVSTSGTKAEVEAESVKTDIRSVYSKWADKKAKKERPRIAGEPVLAPSFENANTLAKRNLSPAFVRASEILTHAWTGLFRVKLDTREKARFVRYFGTFSDVNYTKVRETLKSVHDVVCSKDVTFYYRGAGAPTDPGEDDTPQFLKDQGVNALGPTTAFGYVYAGIQKKGEYHVFLGKAFFDDATRHGRDSLSGVIIHEMTHLTKKTKDHKYGEQPCIDLAKAVGGPAMAIENADSYEYYCESFQSKVTTDFG